MGHWLGRSTSALLSATLFVMGTHWVFASQALDFFVEMDNDDDGYISLREAVSNTDLLRHFSLIDTNDDGKLTEAELLSSEYVQEILVSAND
jgi:Ca2+-binding EF-hand superfamily protein